MENGYDTIQIIISIAPIVISLIAIFLSYKAIRISNKQSLFDRRISSFLSAKKLLETIEINEESMKLKMKELNDDNGKYYFRGYDFLFHDLTSMDNPYELYEISSLIDNIDNNPNMRKEFYLKLGNLKILSTEIRFLFKKETGMLLSQFVFEYQKVLDSTYKYGVFILWSQEVC